MSKKLFAALSLSVLLVACQGNVAVTTDDAAMDAYDGAMMEDTTTDDTMMEEGAAVSSEGTTVEMDVNAADAVTAQ